VKVSNYLNRLANLKLSQKHRRKLMQKKTATKPTTKTSTATHKATKPSQAETEKQQVAQAKQDSLVEVEMPELNTETETSPEAGSSWLEPVGTAKAIEPVVTEDGTVVPYEQLATSN
jgi:hypothetical protein